MDVDLVRWDHYDVVDQTTTVEKDDGTIRVVSVQQIELEPSTDVVLVYHGKRGEHGCVGLQSVNCKVIDVIHADDESMTVRVIPR